MTDPDGDSKVRVQGVGADRLGRAEVALRTKFALSDEAAVALAAVLNLFRLVGAELALGLPAGEIDRFEEAVRTKMDGFASPTNDLKARHSGLVLARHLVGQTLAQIRAQAEVRNCLTPDLGRKVDAAMTEPERVPAKFMN